MLFYWMAREKPIVLLDGQRVNVVLLDGQRVNVVLLDGQRETHCSTGWPEC